MIVSDKIIDDTRVTAIAIDTANPGNPMPQKIATEKYLQRYNF